MIPYVLLMLLNLAIIFKATQYKRTQTKIKPALSLSETRSTRKKAKMTRSILIITFLYIFVTLPGTLVTGFFFNEMMSLEIGLLLLDLIDLLHFIYPAFNFFILFFSNKLFCQEVKFFFVKGNRNQVGFSTSK